MKISFRLDGHKFSEGLFGCASLFVEAFAVFMANFYESAAHFDADPQPLHDLVHSGVELGRSDRQGMTLLHYACREGHMAAVQLLVEQGGAALESQDRDGRTPLHLACLMAAKPQLARGVDHVAIAQYLQEEGAATATQDKYGHTPLSYLPHRAKRIGLMTPAVSGQGAIWAVEQVGKDGTTLNGSVAQSAAVRILRSQ